MVFSCSVPGCRNESFPGCGYSFHRRKRRSSILKRQRAPRAPLSELEFNVVTPTDTSKSRHVSFSRRTVAGFVTNEATATWKNCYEEHNNTLESSGNDSEVKPLSVSHLGKRILDQPLKEVEATDFVSILDNGRGRNIETSISNENFANQLELLDGTAGDKPTAPHHKLELSTFTDQKSKLFRDDLAISGLGDITDFEELDIDRSQGNVFCQRSFRDRRALAECIQVDINMTHVDLSNEDSDMSITDTTNCPKMQDVSKSKKYLQNDKNNVKDCVADQQNIIGNSDVATTETANLSSAINKDSDKILAFDGKSLTFPLDKDPALDRVDYRHTLLPNSLPDNQQRKSIVLNANDELPNCVEDRHSSMSIIKGNPTIIDYNDKSITEPLNVEIEVNTEKRKSIILGNDTGDISITQAIPNVIFPEVQDKRNNIVYESDTRNISVTEALPSNLILADQSFAQGRRKTIVFEDDHGNISITQAVPPNIFGSNPQPDKQRTIVFETDTGDISVTQVVSSKILQEKQSTIVYETDGGNISVTDVIVPEPLAHKRKTIVHADDAGNISITQAVSSNVFLTEKLETASNKRQTILFHDDTIDILKTQVITPNLIITESLENLSDRKKMVAYDKDEGNISITQAIPTNMILPQNLETSSEITEVSSEPSEVLSQISEELEISSVKSKIIVFEDSIADISTTQVVPTNVIMSRLIGILPKPSVSDETFRENVSEVEQISDTELLPPNCKAKSDTSNTDFSPIESENISVIQSIPQAVNLAIKLAPLSEAKEIIVENISMLNLLLPEKSENSIVKREASSVERIKKEFEKVNEELIGVYEMNDAIPIPQNQSISRRSVKLDSDSCNMSMTKPIPATFSTIEKDVLDKPKEDKLLELNKQVKDSEDIHPIKDIVVYKADVYNPTDVLTGKTIEQGDTVSKALSDSNMIPSASNAIENGTDKDTIEKTPEVSLTSKSSELENKENVIEFSQQLVVSAKPSVSLVLMDDQRNKGDEEQHINLTPKDSESLNSERRSETAKSDPDLTSQKESDVDITSISLSIGSLNTHQVRNAILANLLDMSKSSVISLANGIDDKNIMVDITSANDSSTTAGTCSSSGSLFFIKKDSEGEVLTGTDDGKNKVMRSIDTGEDDDFKRNLKQIITSQIDHQIHIPNNRHFEKVVDTNLENMMKKKALYNEKKYNNNYKAADSTKELLEMLSQFTDQEEQDNPLEPDEKNSSGKKKVSYSSQMSPIQASPVHSSPIVHGRQSIILSREDLLSNISIAQVAPQKSHMDVSDTKDLQDSVMGDRSSSSRKNVRLSPEVIKTLRFEDEESLTDSFKIDATSPLRKTAFGETAYMKDKTQVIPSYLKDVSDGIKALMSDLVKPVTEAMPFDTGTRRDTLKAPSTTSAQVQASLISSSQIDLGTEMNSNASSTCILNSSLASSMARTLKGIMKTVNPSAFTSDGSILSDSLVSDAMSAPFGIPAIKPKRTVVDQTVPGMLVFDHRNPLNNVLLAPVDFNDAHRYHPHGSEETLNHSASLVPFIEKGEFGTPRYNIGRVIPVYPNAQSDSLKKNPTVSDTPSKTDGVKIRSSNSIPVVSPSGRSVDRGIATPTKILIDTEVNTIIAMKGANDLLAASSSLTLVDDTLGNIALEAIHSQVSLKSQDSRFKVLYEEPLSPPASKLAEENVDYPVDSAFGKLVHSSTKREKHQHCTLSKLDITPKPVRKMRKRCLSPDGKVSDMPVAIDRKSRTRSRSSPPHSPKKSHSKPPFKSSLKSPPRSPPKSPPKSPSKSKSPSRSKSPMKTKSNTSERKTQKKSSKSKEGTHQLNTTVTVQQLVTEYYLESVDDELKGQILDVINGKSESRQQVAVVRKSETSSFTSSTSHTEGKSGSIESQALSGMNSRGSPMDWQPELINELSSKNLISECESGVNVVARIDMLPFMGTRECEWGSSGGDTWTFLLLHGRLRLSVRLAHRHGNAPRTCVRADTPVVAVTLEASHHNKNPVAALCVHFAGEAMRHVVECGWARAGHVPALLRRCAGVARVALRWGRAMHDAQSRLAYTLDDDGYLALKVANIPLRSVWEVTMRLELATDEACEVPWPRADDVCVHTVVSDVLVMAAEVHHVLAPMPRDWGHAPRTIWKIFRYLKNKTRDDETLFGL